MPKSEQLFLVESFADLPRETVHQTVTRKIAEYYAKAQAAGLDPVAAKVWLIDESEGYTSARKQCWLRHERTPQNQMYTVAGKDVCADCARDMVRAGYSQDGNEE